MKVSKNQKEELKKIVESKKREQILYEICELKLLNELKKEAGEQDLASIENHVIKTFYNRLIKKRLCIVQNIITGRICCDLENNYRIFNSIREATQFINKYGIGLNPDVYQIKPLKLDLIGN